MKASEVASWMLTQINKHGCIYQDDVVDYLVKSKAESHLRENSDGNLVLGMAVLEEFMAVSSLSVVWVKPQKYWRWRVAEDEPGREAKG